MGDQPKVREDTGAEAKREKAQIFTPRLLYSNTSLSLVSSWMLLEHRHPV